MFKESCKILKVSTFSSVIRENIQIFKKCRDVNIRNIMDQIFFGKKDVWQRSLEREIEQKTVLYGLRMTSVIFTLLSEI